MDVRGVPTLVLESKLLAAKVRSLCYIGHGHRRRARGAVEGRSSATGTALCQNLYRVYHVIARKFAPDSHAIVPHGAQVRQHRLDFEVVPERRVATALREYLLALTPAERDYKGLRTSINDIIAIIDKFRAGTA